MNEIVAQPQPERRASQVEIYTAQVLGDDSRTAELFRALPRHIPPARFQRNLLNLIMQKPEMLQYDARLVYREVSKAAALGLLLDPQLGEGYIVPVWNAKANRRDPELRCGYRGLIKLARQSGDIANLYPGAVHERDHFLADEGTEKRLEHQPDYTKPRGKPVCYYAVVIYKDGTKDFEVMDMESIYEIRAKSDGWRAFQSGKIKSTPWSTDEGEMCKKTVLRRLLKRVPQSPDLADALALDSEPLSSTANVIDVPRVAARPAASISARLDQFANDGEADQATDPAPADDINQDQPVEPGSQGSPASETPAASASSEPQPPIEADGADAAQHPDNIKDAVARGRGARREKFPREVPKGYHYKSRQAEADAFLRGWDDENTKMNLEEFGMAE